MAALLGLDDEAVERACAAVEGGICVPANYNSPGQVVISGDEPGETPYAAAIFLHRHSYSSGGATRPTSGCVSLADDELVRVIRLLDARLAPHFAIGPRDWLRTTA